MMKKNKQILILVTLLLTFSIAHARDSKEILESFVADYHHDPMLVEGVFGIKIGEEKWHVVVSDEDEKTSVVLNSGWPEKPTWYFEFFDPEILQRFDKKSMAAGTAMAKAFQSDKTPFDINVMEGFQPDNTFMPSLLQTTFHFWNKGIPEVTFFNDAVTRFTHGSDVVVLHYQPGFRSGWFSIKKGQHVNQNPKSQTNPFPSLMIFTSGSGVGKINEREMKVEKGMSIFIPPEIKHEFWTNEDESLEGILLMFGEGA